MTARPFVLQRDADATGVSGTGVVAEGVEFSDGVVALRWLVPPGRQGSGYPTSVVFHDRGMESVRAIHGHNGQTRVLYMDAAGTVTETARVLLGLPPDLTEAEVHDRLEEMARVPVTEADHDGPDLDQVSEGLINALEELAFRYGARGVARVAARLAEGPK